MGSDAQGQCIAILSADESEPTLHCVHDLAAATAAHVHVGAPGVAGSIVFPLDHESPIQATIALTPTQAAILLAGGFYVNVHSPAHPGGESRGQTNPIRAVVSLPGTQFFDLRAGSRFVLVTAPSGNVRGQIAACVSDADTLCLQGGRFAVEVTWETATDTGIGHPVPATDDSGHFWFFGPQTLELTVKLLDGCPVNDRFWFFAAGLTDVGVTIEVTDTATGTTNTYASARGNAFAPIQDTDAFATCDAAAP